MIVLGVFIWAVFSAHPWVSVALFVHIVIRSLGLVSRIVGAVLREKKGAV